MTHDEFIAEYHKLAPRLCQLFTTSLTNGLLALEELIDGEKAGQRDILEYGIRYVVDGTDLTDLEKMLSNIIRQEDDKYTRQLMELKKEAALQLSAGTDFRIAFGLINSYTDIPWKDDPLIKLVME